MLGSEREAQLQKQKLYLIFDAFDSRASERLSAVWIPLPGQLYISRCGKVTEYLLTPVAFTWDSVISRSHLQDDLKTFIRIVNPGFALNDLQTDAIVGEVRLTTSWIDYKPQSLSKCCQEIASMTSLSQCECLWYSNFKPGACFSYQSTLRPRGPNLKV